MHVCHNCGREWVSEKRQPGFKEYCEGCDAYLHCCLNCRFHEPGRHNECQIPNTDWVSDRAGANFCDQFEFKEAGAGAGNQQTTRKARQQFDQLLGGAPGEEKKPRSFDDLFGE